MTIEWVPCVAAEKLEVLDSFGMSSLPPHVEVAENCDDVAVVCRVAAVVVVEAAEERENIVDGLKPLPVELG